MPATECLVWKRVGLQSTVRLAPASFIDWADLGEGEIVAGCIRGDAAAWGELYARYRTVVYAAAARALHNGWAGQPSCTAEDLVDEFFSDVFARPSAMLGRYAPTRPLARYLKKAAYHNALKRLRSWRFRWPGRAPIVRSLDLECLPEHRNPDRPQLRNQVDRLLSHLDDQSRWLIQAHFGLGSFEGTPLSTKQLAKRLKCCPRTVELRINRILKGVVSFAMRLDGLDEP